MMMLDPKGVEWLELVIVTHSFRYVPSKKLILNELLGLTFPTSFPDNLDFKKATFLHLFGLGARAVGSVGALGIGRDLSFIAIN